MNKVKLKLIACIAAGTLLTGCASMEQSAGLATLGCAGVGVLTGVLTKNAGAGAGAGAGCLALAGVAIYNYHSQQVRTAEQDQQLYGYAAPISSTEVKIRNAAASPEMVRPGDDVNISMDYSVMAPNGMSNINVQETSVLKKDGKVLTTLNDRPISRTLGGQSSAFAFKVPGKLPPGTYVVEQKVQAGTSYDIRQTVFVVTS